MSNVIENRRKQVSAFIDEDVYQKAVVTLGNGVTDIIRDAFYKKANGIDELETDCEQIKHEVENRVLAAETRTEAKERQIKELSGMIEEAKKNNSMLTEKLKKLTSKRKEKLKTLFIWLLVIGFISGMLFSGIIYYILQNN